jgi:hypothetical protein
MLANLRFSDVFAFLDDSVQNQTIAAGSVSGSAIQLGGSQHLRKHVFLFQGNLVSTANSTSFYLATASLSSAAFTSLSASLTSFSFSSSASAAGKFILDIDTDNSWFTDLGTTAAWVKPILVVAGASVIGSLLTLGYNAGSMQASLYNSPTVTVVETDLISG